MNYRVTVLPSALRALKRIDRQHHPRLQAAIELLTRDPRPPGAKQLRGRDAMRVRVGDFRIIYTIKDDLVMIVVVAIGHRKDVYR